MSGRLKMGGTRGTRRTLYLSVASAIGPATRNPHRFPIEWESLIRELSE